MSVRPDQTGRKQSMMTERSEGRVGLIGDAERTIGSAGEAPSAAPSPAVERRIPLLDRVFLTDVPGAGELILVRHGQQTFPESGWENSDGWIDPPLSEVGARQAEAVGAHLGASRLDAVYSSGKQRADATAAAIATRHGLDVRLEPELRELDMFPDPPSGQPEAAESYSLDQLRACEEEFERTQRWTPYPGGETGKDLRARVGAAVQALMIAHPGQVVAVACHTGVINAYLGQILGIGADMFFRPAHASVQRVAFAGTRCVLVTLNEIAHLERALLLTY
jgi:broad specificity phosphatase PhoE